MVSTGFRTRARISDRPGKTVTGCFSRRFTSGSPELALGSETGGLGPWLESA
jgi:hypothetical protein